VTDLVVDASVAVKWFVHEDGTDDAVKILQSGSGLLAPRLVLVEVANALARKVTQGHVTPDDAAEYLATLPRFLTRLLDVDDLLDAALRSACRYRHPVYDFIYLEAARRWDTHMLTADMRLIKMIGGTDLARFVVPLSDWGAE
jgi:predicted nucleic acid-binding protein